MPRALYELLGRYLGTTQPSYRKAKRKEYVTALAFGVGTAAASNPDLFEGVVQVEG